MSTGTLDDGAYVVAWRVVSADSHPVNGAFTFQVGAGNPIRDPSLVTRLLSQDGGNPAAGAVLGVARFVSYAALAVLAGGLVFLVVVWPAGRRRRRIRVLLWVTLAAGVVAGAVAIAVQAPYASGRALTDALKPSEWSEVLRTRSGRAWGLRVLLFAGAGVVLLATLERLRARWWQLVGIFSGLGLFALVAAGGHGTTGRWAGIGFLATVAHLGGMAVWLGGLTLLLVGVLREPDPGGALERTRRFSPIAFGAVAVIIASGVVQAYRQVGSLDALRETEYGRLLLVKTAVVVVLVAVGWWSRRLLHRAPLSHHAGAGGRRRRGRRSGGGGAGRRRRRGSVAGAADHRRRRGGAGRGGARGHVDAGGVRSGGDRGGQAVQRHDHAGSAPGQHHHRPRHGRAQHPPHLHQHARWRRWTRPTRSPCA